MANNGINYSAKNFADIRAELVTMVKQYYSDVFNDFNDSSVGMMLLELNAAVGDMLSFNTDRMYQETQIDYAQERKSVLSLARTFGLKIGGKRPSMTICDFTVTVPVFGDTYNSSYTPIIRAGSQVTGSGKIFETTSDIDFNNPFSSSGIPNRVILPNFDSNGVLLSYNIIKREIVTNGYTKVFKKVITNSDSVPFLEIILPEDNVISIDSVISLDGTNYLSTPSLSDFLNTDNKWFEVNALAESEVFVEDNSKTSDATNVTPGKWVTTTKKFITEYTDLGFIKLIFGGGSQDLSSVSDFISSPLFDGITNLLKNTSLGSIPNSNTTIFIKYRVGGGADSNLGVNVLTNLGTTYIDVNGPNQTINNTVKNSLTVTNLFPAIGGKDSPSVEEIRNMVKYNFSSQNRAVTLNDYQTRIAQMPSKYGVPFRCGVTEEQNKIKIYLLTLDENGKISNTTNSVIKDNVATYLSNYRMINDYIEITNGKVFNIGLEVDVIIDKLSSQSQIVTQIINNIISFFNISNLQMGDNIYISKLYETLNSVGGVINIVDIRFYNKVGGVYSLNEVSQSYLDYDTRMIDLTDNNMLFGEPQAMFEIKNPNTDILIRFK